MDGPQTCGPTRERGRGQAGGVDAYDSMLILRACALPRELKNSIKHRYITTNITIIYKIWTIAC
jgi:hypothetical protein